MERAHSNAEQSAEAHDMGGLDPNNPDVQQQLRQQEMNKLMWLYVQHTHRADPSQKMTSRPITRMKMKRIRIVTGTSQDRRSTRTGTTSFA